MQQLDKIISKSHNKHFQESTLDKFTVFAKDIFKELNICRTVISFFDSEESQKNLISGLSEMSLCFKGEKNNDLPKFN